MRRFSTFFLIITMLLSMLPFASFASDAGVAYQVVPHVIRPGKYYDIQVDVSTAGNASLQLLTADGSAAVHTIYVDYPLQAGTTSLPWDGLRPDHTPVPQGEYLLRLITPSGQADAQVRIGAPYPMLTDITQSSPTVDLDTMCEVSFYASEAGNLRVQIESLSSGVTADLDTIAIGQGPGSFQWRGMLNNEQLPVGAYAVIMTLRAENGTESVSQRILVDIVPDETGADAEEQVSIVTTSTAAQAEETGLATTPTDPPQAEPTPEPTPEPPSVSAPYSSQDQDGSFWTMTPGETDDAVIWDILMQPITVYDDGKLKATEHAYMMENPDGTGIQVAQLHATSQGVHVIGTENEHGYVLVEAFSNYDRSYSPETEEERAHAFDLKQGYVKASNLKTIEVQQDMALLIDKLTQRMYLFINGERVTEFLIATGTFSKPEDMLFETVPGEFITVSHTGTLVDGNMNSAMAIRINGGILVHEVPHKLNADGTKNYSSFEGYLGSKQSHGCIRVQRKKTAEGYNQQWIWENFKRATPYKVIIWDDAGRVDTPTTWQENPKN